MKFLRYCIILFCLFISNNPLFANTPVLNVYWWTGVVPDTVIRQFEKETGIKVNVSTYENNEVMYTKLRAVKQPGYDVIQPSSYMADRMQRQSMLEPLDKTLLPNWHHINPRFLHPIYDPQSQYTAPFIWGVTGIFVNRHAITDTRIQKWADLWRPNYQDQLMLLDDAREVFSMALISLGYSARDTNPEHIKQAYLKLKALLPNIKVFASDTVVSIIIDEDATLGMAWNGDVYKANRENSRVQFILPKEGFVIWIDSLAIPKTAPHKENAYRFINFLLRPDIAKTITLYTRYATANLSAQKTLPAAIKDNPIIYPAEKLLRHGQVQVDVDETTLALIEKYWEELKLGG